LLSQRIKCAESKSCCLGMLRECLVYSSMRLGVPFIAPRQLGAVESIPGRQILSSVAWRTGQSGAHRTLSGADFFPSLAKPTVGAWEPLAHRTLSGVHRTVWCGFLSFFGEADRWRFGAVGAPDTVRCTPDSPVPPSDRWLGHVSHADRAVDRWPGRPLAHRTVRCTPDSPVNYSRTPLITS
jgi:hypothetical protein